MIFKSLKYEWLNQIIVEELRKITSYHIHLLSKKDCKILGNSGLTWCCCFTLLEVADCSPSFCVLDFQASGGGCRS